MTELLNEIMNLASAPSLTLFGGDDQDWGSFEEGFIAHSNFKNLRGDQAINAQQSALRASPNNLLSPLLDDFVRRFQNAWPAEMVDGKYPLQPLLDNVLKLLKHHLAPTVCRFAAVKALLACKQTKGMSVVDHTFNSESIFKHLYDMIALELKQSGDVMAPWLAVSQVLPIRPEELE
jgi:hypothetical protein